MTRILIIGAGIAGLATATALRQKGFDAPVYESASELRAAGKGIGLPPNGMRALSRIGAADAVERHGTYVDRMEVWDKDAGRLTVVDQAFMEQRYGFRTLLLHRSDLQRTLLDCADGAALHLGKHCTRYTTDGQGAVAYFSDGSTAEGDMLIAADGIHSVVRRSLHPTLELRYSGQTCYRGVADITLSDGLERVLRETWGGDLRFGFAPIRPGQVYWYGLATAATGTAEGKGARKTWLSRRFADFPGPVPNIIAATPEPEIISTDLYDFPPIKRWWLGRVALIGDAAHAMMPNLAQGGAQALVDAVVLADALGKHGATAEALRDYQRRRIGTARRTVKLSRQVGKLAHLRSRQLRRLRNVVMRNTPDFLTRKQMERLFASNE